MSDGKQSVHEGEPVWLGSLLLLIGFDRRLHVIENLEVVLEAGDGEGSYREGYAGYGQLIDVVGSSNHQSCLILTSREAPPELGQLSGGYTAVRTLELGGLTAGDAQTLTADKGLRG